MDNLLNKKNGGQLVKMEKVRNKKQKREVQIQVARKELSLITMKKNGIACLFVTLAGLSISFEAILTIARLLIDNSNSIAITISLIINVTINN